VEIALVEENKNHGRKGKTEEQQGVQKAVDPNPQEQITRMYSKVSRLASWSENCKWYSSLPLGAVVLLFRERDS
jgi:hypothetical protein